MAFERSAFLSLMPHTITVSTRTSHNNYGEPSYASGTSYRARVVHKPSFIRGGNGENIEIRTVVWVASTGIISADDRITLPDGTTPPVLGIERYPDEDGSHHHKVLLGWGGR